MTTLLGTFIGVDVGKASLDVAVYGSDTVWRVANDAQGVAQVLERVQALDAQLVAVEATGGYEQLLVQTLLTHSLPVAVVNPTRVRALARATGKLAKTDAIDARLIAEFAGNIQTQALAPQAADEIRLRALVNRREQLVEMRVAEQNRLGTMHASLQADIRSHIEWMSRAIQEIEAEVEALLDRLPEWRERAELLDSIPGVGRITAVTVLVEMPELGQLDRQKIAALAGLAPFNQDSGRKRGKRRIFGGRKGVRRVLYMACLSAKTYNPVIRSFYLRLSEKGKVFKVAITACMRKMLTIMNAMIRDQVPWRLPLSKTA